ncbi:hypothetical protein [Pseudoalteromonas piscicida]|uniref:hypothetical protein n=1 Tax=Pseudoalteromonas piscicida TaxID=43662 RepID=UPI001CB716BC|nr:hypothetical protein [Pseudoalteromonas piscicida]
MKLSNLALTPIAAAVFAFNVSALGHGHNNQHAILFPGETAQIEVEPSAKHSLKIGQKSIIFMNASLMTVNSRCKSWAGTPTGLE